VKRELTPGASLMGLVAREKAGGSSLYILGPRLKPEKEKKEYDYK